MDPTGKKYMTCCGKVICSGCCHAPVYDNQGNKVDGIKCAFCRVPSATSDEEIVKRTMILVEAGDARAIYDLGTYYREGTDGFHQNYTKALELFHRAGKLGYAEAYTNIGVSYHNGEGVEVDKKKAVHYWELAAIGGSVAARFNLGHMEGLAGNIDRALKHWMVSIIDGDAGSLKQIKRLYSNGFATKEDYTKALQAYQAYLGEIKSPQRDEAAAFSMGLYRYYR